jgi:hypothetical protein
MDFKFTHFFLAFDRRWFFRLDLIKKITTKAQRGKKGETREQDEKKKEERRRRRRRRRTRRRRRRRKGIVRWTSVVIYRSTWNPAWIRQVLVFSNSYCFGAFILLAASSCIYYLVVASFVYLRAYRVSSP